MVGRHNAKAAWLILLCLLLLPSFASVAQTFEVVRMAPTDGVLAPDRALHLHVRYRSDQPVRLQARGMRNGAEVPGTANASAAYRAGEGDVLVWIAYPDPATIDSVKVTLSDADWRPLAAEVVPVRAQWHASAAPVAEATWVADVRDQQASLAVPPPQRQASGIAGDALFAAAIPLALIGYLLVQILLPLRWEGRWRLAALLPLLPMAVAVVVSIAALSAGSNLWPIWMILLAPFALAYLLVLVALRWMAGRRG